MSRLNFIAVTFLSEREREKERGGHIWRYQNGGSHERRLINVPILESVCNVWMGVTWVVGRVSNTSREGEAEASDRLLASPWFATAFPYPLSSSPRGNVGMRTRSNQFARSVV